MDILKCTGLTKRFGGLVAVSNVTFEVNQGEIFGIIGPNGAGKTTLFNLITGIYPPDAGEVIFKGRRITGLPPHKISRLGIVKTYQIPRPFQQLTVLENLIVASISSRDMKYEEAVKQGVEILKMLGLDSVKDKLAGSLLPYQLKRLEMARALACKPELLLMDEPAAGMREGEIDELLKMISKISEGGTTIIVVEHRMEVITQISTRVMVMHQGQKLCEGSPEEVLHNKMVIEAYLGEEA